MASFEPCTIISCEVGKWNCTTEENEAPDLQDEYVLDVVKSCDGSAVFSSITTGAVQVYSAQTLQREATLGGHRGAISDIAAHPTSPAQAATSGHDGTLRLWDARVGTKAQMVIPAGEHTGATPVSCALGFEGALLACGGRDRAFFFDVRAGSAAPVASLGDALLSGSVNALEWHPLQRGVLVGGDEAGIVCAFNTMASSGEDNVVSICNVDCWVSKLGFFGAGMEGMHVLTGNEGLQLWHLPSGQRIHAWDDARPHCNALLQRHSLAGEFNVIGSCLYDASADRLSVVAGSHGGAAALFDVAPDGFNMRGILGSGHRAAIRGACLLNDAGVLLTCGEDARICAWATTEAARASVAGAASAAGGAWGLKRGASDGQGAQKKARRGRTAPLH